MARRNSSWLQSSTEQHGSREAGAQQTVWQQLSDLQQSTQCAVIEQGIANAEDAQPLVTAQTQQVLTRLCVVVVDLAAARRHAQLGVLPAASLLVNGDVKQGRQEGTLLFAV
jgi:hypothetical protein